MRKISLKLFLISIVFIFSILFFVYDSIDIDKGLYIHFIDVGQGDAILLKQGNIDVLIDGGRSRNISAKLSKILGKNDREIEVLIATHPDADHIGGLISVFDDFEVKNLFLTSVESDTNIYKSFTKKVKSEVGLNENIVSARETVILNGLVLDIIWPLEENYPIKDFSKNDSSISILAQYNKKSILLTGDASSKVESILSEVFDLNVDVLKAGHHGSCSSTSKEFLEETTPEVVIFSFGENNSYGHPCKKLIDELESNEIDFLNTVEEDVILYIDEDGILDY